MKWTVAIVTVVVGVTGLCRADDARRTFDDRDRCLVPDGVSPEQKLESCTVVIQSAGQTRQVLVAAYRNRGVAYNRKGEYDRAIADLDEAIPLDPKFALAYNNRGVAYKDKGELDRAIADYDEAIRLNPNYAKAYNDRGVVYASKRDYARAIADYDQALTSDLDDPYLTEVRQSRERALAATATPPK